MAKVIGDQCALEYIGHRRLDLEIEAVGAEAFADRRERAAAVLRVVEVGEVDGGDLELGCGHDGLRKKEPQE